MIYHNKLVRDKIPQLIQSRQKSCTFRKLDEQSYLLELRKKLSEEVNEYLEDPCKEELADILEVIDALAKTKGLTFSEVFKIKEKKKEERGAFTDRIFLESVTEGEDDPRDNK